MRGSKLWCIAGVSVATMAGCSLFTDLGGVTGQAEQDGGGGASDAATGSDGSSAIDANDPDSGTTSDAPIAGLLANDGFESGVLCMPWTPYFATSDFASEAYSGARSCKVCQQSDGAAGGIRRGFGPVPAGMYSVSVRAKSLGATNEVRITIERSLPDGGVEPSYHVGILGGAPGWTLVQHAAATSGHLLVAVWFGEPFKGGECGLVDEIIVKKEP